MNSAPVSLDERAGKGRGATSELGRFAAQLEFDDLPETVVVHAKLCVLDVIGCALFASRTQWCAMVTEFASATSGTGEATIWGTDIKAGAESAALANGTAGHGFELDDIHPSGVHPGPLAIPAAMAMAETLDVGGDELVAAIVAGFEVGNRIGMAVTDGHLKAGFHAQGTVGVFLAATAAGRILRLSPEQMGHALGIAGSFASGLIAVQEGAMTKRLHSGQAAQSGVLAARLARKGFTGIEDVLENPFGGFCSTMGGGTEELSRLTAGLGSDWETLNIGFKLYPCCGSSHSALKVVRGLMDETPFIAQEVESVAVRASSRAVVHVGWPYRPDGIAGAQMNLPFVLAVMLRHGEVATRHFTEAGISNPETMALARRIEMIPDERIDSLGTPGRHGTHVTIRLLDGTSLTGSAAYRPGSLRDPVGRQAIQGKFESLLADSHSPDVLSAISDLVDNLEATRVRSLTALLGAVETA